MNTATKIAWTRGDNMIVGATWHSVAGCPKVSEPAWPSIPRKREKP